MKKCISILLLCLFAFNSCEKDDFCTENPVTPNLIIRFFDKNDITSLKNVSQFSVIAENKTDSLFTNLSIDSIAIPINGNASETVYTLKINDKEGTLTDNKYATLRINYNSVEDYVSRSCGFRYIFKNIELSITDNEWIDSISNKSIPEINNQIRSHVQIFH